MNVVSDVSAVMKGLQSRGPRGTFWARELAILGSWWTSARCACRDQGAC